jgi:fucose permease
LVVHLKDSSADDNILLRMLRKLTPPELPWASIYWIFAISASTMVMVLLFSRFPKVECTAEERVGSLDMYRNLARQRVVWLYFVAMFAYVGCEQGTADWMSSFLRQYHGFDPHTTGAAAVSWFWGLLTAGCIVGMLLLKIFDSRKVLIGACGGGVLCFIRCIIWAREHFRDCISRGGVVCFSDVAYRGVAGT